jgi:hypothetical protein
MAKLGKSVDLTDEVERPEELIELAEAHFIHLKKVVKSLPPK